MTMRKYFSKALAMRRLHNIALRHYLQHHGDTVSHYIRQCNCIVRPTLRLINAYAGCDVKIERVDSLKAVHGWHAFTVSCSAIYLPLLQIPLPDNVSHLALAVLSERFKCCGRQTYTHPCMRLCLVQYPQSLHVINVPSSMYDGDEEIAWQTLRRTFPIIAAIFMCAYAKGMSYDFPSPLSPCKPSAFRLIVRRYTVEIVYPCARYTMVWRRGKMVLSPEEMNDFFEQYAATAAVDILAW